MHERQRKTLKRLDLKVPFRSETKAYLRNINVLVQETVDDAGLQFSDFHRTASIGLVLEL